MIILLFFLAFLASTAIAAALSFWLLSVKTAIAVTLGWAVLNVAGLIIMVICGHCARYSQRTTPPPV